MIKPTVGRIVLFHPSWYHDQPYAAIITYVHSDTQVNLFVFDPEGVSHAERYVSLKQNDGENFAGGQFYCEWMPYQIGQAKAQTQV